MPQVAPRSARAGQEQSEHSVPPPPQVSSPHREPLPILSEAGTARKGREGQGGELAMSLQCVLLTFQQTQNLPSAWRSLPRVLRPPTRLYPRGTRLKPAFSFVPHCQTLGSGQRSYKDETEIPKSHFPKSGRRPPSYLTLSVCLTLFPTDPVPGCKGPPLRCEFGHPLAGKS